jgi:hypothetical protein
VGLSNRAGTGKYRTVRLKRNGDQKVLFRNVPIWDLELASDGADVVAARAGNKRTRIRVYDARTGAVEASRRFHGSLTLLDMQNGRALLGGFAPRRTIRWNVANGNVHRVSDRAGYAADISANRLATFTKDPYNGGCSVVSSLARPGARLWESCTERVDTFAPRGSRMATIPILSDGVGPSEVWLRRAAGQLLASYEAKWFGPLSWESDKALLLDTNGRRKTAVVRCRVDHCKRASKLQPVPTFRIR